MPFLIPFAILGLVVALPILLIRGVFSSYRKSGDEAMDRELKRRMLARMRGQTYRPPRRFLLGLWDKLAED
jgi:hypothetical protein